MIKQIKNLMLIAVAAMGFASCQNEGIEEVTRPQEVVMTITAEADETRTAIDETNKTVKWSAGDQLKVIENSATYRTTTPQCQHQSSAKHSRSTAWLRALRGAPS